MAGWTLPLNLLFLSFTWGSDLHHYLRDLLTFPCSLLIFPHKVIFPNKILACLILSWHLLKNRWGTKTNIPSLVPNAQRLSLNSSVWPTVPSVIWLLLTSFFSLPLLLCCVPSTQIYSHSFHGLWSLAPRSVHMLFIFLRTFLSPTIRLILQAYASLLQEALPDSPRLNWSPSVPSHHAFNHVKELTILWLLYDLSDSH